MPTTLQLSRVAMSRLRQHAETIGASEAQLASDLLEVIARDDLYDATLDAAKNAADFGDKKQDQGGQVASNSNHRNQKPFGNALSP